MQLFINGQPSGASPFAGPLREPPRAQDGDFTFGCGMFAGKPADPCACLLSEVRVTEGSRHPADWIWSPSWRDAAISLRNPADPTRAAGSNWTGSFAPLLNASSAEAARGIVSPRWG